MKKTYSVFIGNDQAIVEVDHISPGIISIQFSTEVLDAPSLPFVLKDLKRQIMGRQDHTCPDCRCKNGDLYE
jgi:hypothetical protein